MRIAAVALAFLLSVSARAQDVAIKADEHLSAWTTQGRFSGTVLIAKDGKVLLRRSYGLANIELGVPNTPEMIYRIGSITDLTTRTAKETQSAGSGREVRPRSAKSLATDQHSAIAHARLRHPKLHRSDRLLQK